MFLREFVAKGLIMWVIGAVAFSIAPLVLDFMLLCDANRQQLWDKVAGTIAIGDSGVGEHDVVSGGAQSLSLPPA